MKKKISKFVLLLVGVFCLVFYYQQIEAATVARNERAVVGWFTDKEGHLYYANAQGKVVKHRQKIDGHDYFFDKDGRCYRNTPVYWDGKNYSDKSNSKGFGKVQGMCFVDKNGRMLKNRTYTYKKKLYLIANNGQVFRNTLVHYDGKTYLKKPKDAKAIKTIYFVNKDGQVVVNSRIRVGSKYYYSKKNGELRRNGLFTFKSKRYYANARGVAVSNSWVTVNGSLYRTKGKGELRRNQTFKLKRVSYTINKSGKVTNTVMPIGALYQGHYGSLAFGNTTIPRNGCGVVSTTMALRYLTNRDITVAQMRDIAKPYFDAQSAYVNGKVHEGFFEKAASKYKKKVKITTNDAEALAAAKRGKAVLSFQRAPSRFTTLGHFIVIKSADSKNRVRINDPNDNSSKKFNDTRFDFYRTIAPSSVKYVIFSH